MKYNHEMMWKELKEKLYPRADKDGLLSTADLDEVMEDLENDWQKLVNVKSVDLPQAFETTEILNEVKADKGLILTEEELTLNEKALKNSARAGAMYATDHNLIEDIIDSHRELFKANASLSFEKMKLREIVVLANNLIPSENTLWTSTLKSILEELK